MTEAEVAAYRKRRSMPAKPPTGSQEKRIVKLEPSRLEILFAQQIAALGLPEPVQQYAGAVPGRKYRIDFAWPDRKMAVEVQGMVHRIKGRFKSDCEKLSLLTIAGWRVLPVSGDDVRSGRAAAWLTALLGQA